MTIGVVGPQGHLFITLTSSDWPEPTPFHTGPSSISSSPFSYPDTPVVVLVLNIHTVHHLFSATPLFSYRWKLAPVSVTSRCTWACCSDEWSFSWHQSTRSGPLVCELLDSVWMIFTRGEKQLFSVNSLWTWSWPVKWKMEKTFEVWLKQWELWWLCMWCLIQPQHWLRVFPGDKPSHHLVTFYSDPVTLKARIIYHWKNVM